MSRGQGLQILHIIVCFVPADNAANLFSVTYGAYLAYLHDYSFLAHFSLDPIGQWTSLSAGTGESILWTLFNKGHTQVVNLIAMLKKK